MKKQIALGILGLMSLSLASCGTHMSTYRDADKYVAGNCTYESEITTLDIDWVSGDLILVEDITATEVKIEEKTNVSEEKGLVHTYLNDGVLKVKFAASGYWFNKPFIEKSLTITYRPGLDKINIDLTSGNLSANGLTAKKVGIDMTSGSAVVEAVIADDVDVDVTSGSIELKSATAKNMFTDMTSGTVKVNYVSIEKSSFDLTSGKIKMTLPLDGGTVKVSKTSGSVYTNRECQIAGDTYKFGSGSANIKVSMTSGTLTID